MARLTGPEAFRHIAEKLLTEEKIAGGICYEVDRLISFRSLQGRDSIDFDVADDMERLIVAMQHPDHRYEFVWPIGTHVQVRALACYFLAEIMENA